MSNLDPGHFGSSMAAINLADILSQPDNRRYARFVSKHWNNYTEIFNELWYSKISIAHKTHLAELLTNHILNVINNKKMPKSIKSHFCNIVCARRSIWNKVAASVTVNTKAIKSRIQAQILKDKIS